MRKSEVSTELDILICNEITYRETAFKNISIYIKYDLKKSTPNNVIVIPKPARNEFELLEQPKQSTCD